MNIAMIGAGPSGIMSALCAQKNPDVQITFFDTKDPLMTLLPTGGGRCNLAYAEFDNSELVKFYPRGQKFLLSVFSRFSTGDALEFFEKIGVKTYVQDDLRIFPVSNSAADVRRKMLSKLDKNRTYFLKEKVSMFEKQENKFKITTENADYIFDKVVFAGGIRHNEKLLKKAGVAIVAPKPALGALCVEEKSLYGLSGVAFKSIFANIPALKKELCGDLLITHKAISGPLAYRISSYCAYEKYPLELSLNFVGQNFEDFDKILINVLDKNSKKDIVNIVSEFVSRSFALYLLNKSKINPETKASQVNKNMRIALSGLLTAYPVCVCSPVPEGEIVTAGGVDTDKINPKTMEYKDISGLYFCGEVLNVDGLTGGFNLQNCWSTGFVAGSAVRESV